MKFKFFLKTTRRDEWDMSPVWERRSHRMPGIGLAALGTTALLFIVMIVGRTVL